MKEFEQSFPRLSPKFGHMPFKAFNMPLAIAYNRRAAITDIPAYWVKGNGLKV
jgi:hypothetical protein